jgi:hypothetical protein
MGGWAVLDYGLHYAEHADPYLRLGYASYLSAWALMNTGTAETNYGYWFPGPENDGGAGGGFEPAAYGMTWLGQPHNRGSWLYACEIDLGYCGALRTAATMLADDDIFGRVCYGGDWRAERDHIEVIPKDGVRRRFYAMLDERQLQMKLSIDRFAAGPSIRLKSDLSEIDFDLERVNPDTHQAGLHLVGLPPGAYQAQVGGAAVAAWDVSESTEDTIFVELPIPAGKSPLVVTVRRSGN